MGTGAKQATKITEGWDATLKSESILRKRPQLSRKMPSSIQKSLYISWNTIFLDAVAITFLRVVLVATIRAICRKWLLKITVVTVTMRSFLPCLPREHLM